MDYVTAAGRADRNARDAAAWPVRALVWMLGVVLAAPIAGAIEWGPAITVDVSGQNPEIAVSANAIHMVWGTLAANPIGDAAYARSLDGGLTWQDWHVFSSSAHYQMTRVAADGSLVVGTWTEQVAGEWEPRVAVSADEGVTWSSAASLADPVVGQVRTMGQSVVGSTVAVAWSVWDVANVTYYVRISFDGGATWEPTRTGAVATPDGSFVGFGDVAVSDDRLILAHNDGQSVFALASADWGATWETPTALQTGSPDFAVRHIAVEGSDVLTYWAGPSRPHVSLSRDAGATWLPQSDVASGVGGNPNTGGVALRGGYAIAVWRLAAAQTLGWSESTDGGETWSGAQSYDGEAFPVVAHVALTATHAYVAYFDSGGGGVDIVRAARAVSPTVSVGAPSADQILPAGTTSTALTVVAAGNPAPEHWHWQLAVPFSNTGLAEANHVDAGLLTDTITGLADGGAYTVYVALVDEAHMVFDATTDPNARATVSFSVAASEAPTADAVTAIDAQGAAGTVVTVPIDLYDISATAGVTAVDLSLTFDATLLMPLTDGADTTPATLGPVVPAGWTIEQFEPGPGQINISLAAAFGDAIMAGGTIVNIAFDVSPTAAANATSPLDLTKADLNEGAISATPTDGMFTVLNLMYGDVTGNGVVSAYDASWVLEYVVNAALTEPVIIQFPIETEAPTWAVLPLAPEDAFDVADVDQDVAIGAMDASYVLQAAVGMIALPVAPAAAPMIAAAAPSYRLTASATSARPGGQIVVSLDASAAADLRAGELVLDFDDALLKPAAVSLRRRGVDGQTARPLLVQRERDGRLAVAFASAQPLDAADAVIEVAFEASRLISHAREGGIRVSHLRLNGSRVEAGLAFPFRIEPFANRLMANYPNPFNPETWIPFELAADAHVTVSIYDLVGNRVRALDLGVRPTGDHTGREDAAHWDGRNAQGERVASGLYVYELTAGEYRAVRRMVVRK